MKVLVIITLALISHLCGNTVTAELNQNFQQSHLFNSQFEASRIKSQLRRLQQKTSSKLIVESTVGMEHILKTDVPQYLTEWQSGNSNRWLNRKILGKNLFKYALSISAIGAGTALLNDFSKTGEIRPHKALDFLTDSQFFKSSLGIFMGSTMLSALGNFLPSGVGPVLKTVPSFLGAALGYEWSQGNLSRLDWLKEGFSAIASSAAFVALGGGGLIAIAGGVVASMLSDQIYSTLKNKKYNNPSHPSFSQTSVKNSVKVSENVSVKYSSPKLHLRQKILGDIQNNLSNKNLEKTRESLVDLDRITSEN